MPFSLLHISDIHLGPAVRIPTDLFAAAETLAREIADDLNEYGLLPIDAVVASGDLTQMASADEFDATFRLLTALASAIGVPRENFLIIPGNHDIAWYPPKGRSSVRLQPNLRSDAKVKYESFMRRFRNLSDADPLPVCNADVLLLRDVDPPVAIMGLNSARFEDPRSAGLGYVGEGQILELLLQLRKAGVNRDWIKIAALHHHLVPVLDANAAEWLKPKEDRKLTMMVDAATVLNFLFADGFQLILHGHLHMAFCTRENREPMTTRSPIAAGEIIIHGAGTFGMDNSEGDKENHYAVLSVSRRELVIHSIARSITTTAVPAAAERKKIKLAGRSGDRALLPLPAEAEIRFMRVREDNRESWLDMYGLIEGDASSKARFMTQVRSSWEELGPRSEFLDRFEAAAAEFTPVTVKVHEQALETMQLSFLQYFLGKMKNR